jgi:hypothetical protein
MAKFKMISEDAVGSPRIKLTLQKKSNWNDLLAGINPREDEVEEFTNWEPVEHVNRPFAEDRKTKKQRKLELKKQIQKRKMERVQAQKKMKADLSRYILAKVNFVQT